MWALAEKRRTGFLCVIPVETYVQASSEGVGQGHVFGGYGPDARSVPAAADVEELGFAVRLPNLGELGHAVQDGELTTGGGGGVGALEEAEDEIADGQEALRVVVLVVRVHLHEGCGLRGKHLRQSRGKEYSQHTGCDTAEYRVASRAHLNAHGREEVHCGRHGAVHAQDAGQHGSSRKASLRRLGGDSLSSSAQK